MPLNLRQCRKALRRILPEAVKRRWRGRLFGYRGSTTADSIIERRGDSVFLRTQGVEAVYPKSFADNLQYHLVENGDSAEELHGFIEAARREPGVLIDVGAAEGLFSTLFCLAHPTNRAVAFEPSPELYQEIIAGVELNGLADRVTVMNAAVGAADELVSGALNEAGMLVVNHAADQAVSIAMHSLDGLMDRIPAPVAVKIDVEGYEAEVLRGGRKFLATHRPTLFLEFHLDMLDAKGVRVEELLRDLVDLGYRFESSLGSAIPNGRISGSPKAIVRFVARHGLKSGDGKHH